MLQRLRRAFILLLVVAGLAVLAVIVLLRPPAWWSPVDRDDPDAVALGEEFEQGCVSEVHRVRPDAEPWAVRIKAEEVNAWLATRLPKWCAHAGVPELGDAEVRFTEGTIELAVDVPDLPSVVVARLAPEVTEAGILAHVEGASIGRLPMSFLARPSMVRTVSSMAGGEADESVKALLAAIGGEPAPRDFELADGRHVRLRDIEVHEGELLLEFETRKPGR